MYYHVKEPKNHIGIKVTAQIQIQKVFDAATYPGIQMGVFVRDIYCYFWYLHVPFNTRTEISYP